MARDFDREWRGGYWNYMRGLAHVPRYGVIASVVHQVHPSPRVLDVGCGEGTLLDHLGPRLRQYTGFDVSPEAVRRARETYGSDRVRFETGSILDWTTEDTFDVIVFNGVLYLFPEKRRELLKRYERMLAPGGVMLVEHHTTFRKARSYFRQVGALQDAASDGWSRNHEVMPVDGLDADFDGYEIRAHYTLVNWSVDNREFPCRHLHVLSPRPSLASLKSQEDVYRALHAGSRDSNRAFSRDSDPYLFGSESMGDVLAHLDVSDRRVLTILGGADQWLGFLGAGARADVAIDVSVKACFVAEIKAAAARAFAREAFLDHLLALQEGNTSESQRRALAKLAPDLSPSATAWLEEALAGREKVKRRVNSPDRLRKLNPYLASDEIYRRVQQTAGRTRFLPADLFVVAEVLEGERFDVVYTANVLDFNREKTSELVAGVLPLTHLEGQVVSYEFASHPRVEGEYGDLVSCTRFEFEGLVYGGIDAVALLTCTPETKARQVEEDRQLEQAKQAQASLTELVADGLQDVERHARQGSSARLFAARVNRRELMLRAPRQRTGIDTDASHRAHRLVHELAHLAGAGHLALPTAVVNTPDSIRAEAGRATVLVMPKLDDSWKAATDPAAGPWLERVSEEDRVIAALLCVLTGQSDAVAKNVQVSASGLCLLLDLDQCLGRAPWWGKPNRACFLPGGELEFASSAVPFEALPTSARALVESLCRRSRRALARRFGLTPAEASFLADAARAVRRSGLPPAAK